MTALRASRRQLLLGAASGVLAGCGAGRPSTVDTLGVDPQAPLEVVVHNGVYGEGYARSHEARYKKRYPRADIRHSSAQDIGASLRRRFAAGTPPDVVQNSGPGVLPPDVVEPADLQPLLDAPSLDVPDRTVGQTLRPGAMSSGAVHYAYTVYGAWHSGRLLDSVPPRTWDEHVALCRRLAASGIVPWTYDFPHEMSWALLVTAVKTGGLTVAEAIDNLEPNAWLAGAVRSAAEAWHQLVRERWVRPGVAFGQAAFRSGGSWLSGSDDGLAVAPVPGLDSGDALPASALLATPEEAFVVPAKAANRAGGLAYLRVMLSRAGAADFTTAVSSLTAVTDGASGLALRPGLASAVAALSAAGPNTFTLDYPQRYPALQQAVVGPACGLFLAGEIGPADFLTRCQRGADEIARGS